MQSDLLQYTKRSLRAQNAKPNKIKTYHIETLAINVCNQNCANTRTHHREQKKPHHMKTWTLHTNNFSHPNQDFTHDLVTQLVKIAFSGDYDSPDASEAANGLERASETATQRRSRVEFLHEPIIIVTTVPPLL